MVAVSTTHPLAGRDEVGFDEISGDPFAALPLGRPGPRFLARRQRAWRPPARIAAEVTSADEVFELVPAGTAVVLLAEGNAAVYARPGITCIPVTGLEPRPARDRLAPRRPPPLRHCLRPSLPGHRCPG